MGINIYILFHGNCYDGFGAAYAAWKKFGSGALYVPCFYGSPIPEVPIGAEVYMIDFSGSREEMEALKRRCDKFVILDHHKTAEANLAGLPYATFDMNRSGAMMAWEYFHPYTPAPALIQHIQDRDLWLFKLPQTKEIHAALLSYPMEFEVWDGFDITDLSKQGSALLRYQDQLVEMICGKTGFQEIGGYLVPCVNSTSHWSEVGNTLCKKYPDAPFCVSYYVDADESAKFSLRSVGDFDVSIIAKKYKGGGHCNAAGFVIKPGESL